MHSPPPHACLHPLISTPAVPGPDTSFEQSVQLLLGQMVCEELWGVPTSQLSLLSQHTPAAALAQPAGHLTGWGVRHGMGAAEKREVRPEEAPEHRLSAQVGLRCCTHTGACVLPGHGGMKNMHISAQAEQGYAGMEQVHVWADWGGGYEWGEVRPACDDPEFYH